MGWNHGHHPMHTCPTMYIHTSTYVACFAPQTLWSHCYSLFLAGLSRSSIPFLGVVFALHIAPNKGLLPLFFCPLYGNHLNRWRCLRIILLYGLAPHNINAILTMFCCFYIMYSTIYTTSFVDFVDCPTPWSWPLLPQLSLHACISNNVLRFSSSVKNSKF